MTMMTTSERERAMRRAPLVVALALSAGVTSLAPAAERELLPFGMVGLARDQSAVLNLVRLGPSDQPESACRVLASFVDASGQVLRDQAGNAVTQTFDLRDGVAVQLTLHSEGVLTGAELRKLIRAVVSELTDNCADRSQLVGTLEIVLRDGSTQSMYALRVGPRDPPPPDPNGH